MLPKIFLILFSSVLLLGNSSCQSRLNRVDAYECILITVDEKAEERPLEQWYWFCRNRLTKEEKSIWLKDSTKCIRNSKNSCKWYGTDVLELKIIQDSLERRK
jgi:hypothetical protein